MNPELDDDYAGSFDDEVDDTALGDDFGDNDPVEDDAAAPEADDDSASEPEGEPDGSEDEAEGEQDADTAEPEGKPAKEPMVPKSRMDSFRLRLREAEARLAEVEKAKAAAPKGDNEPVDLDARLADLGKQFAQAALDGDADQMAAINQQMMTAQREQFQTMLAEARDGAVNTSRDSVLTDSLVDELVANHGQLNPNSEDFDQDLVGRINDMRDFYEAKGFKESEALVKTIEVLMPQAFAASETEAPPAASKPPSLKKKIDAANRQPPSMKGVGEDAPAHGRGQMPDINKMSLADLDTLSDSDWDAMLGNTL